MHSSICLLFPYTNYRNEMINLKNLKVYKKTNIKKKICCCFFSLMFIFFLIVILNCTIQYRTYLLDPTQNNHEYKSMQENLDLYQKNYLSDKNGELFWGDIRVLETNWLNFKKDTTYIVPYAYIQISDIPTYNTMKWPITIGLVSFRFEEDTEIKSITSRINDLELFVELNENTDISYPISRNLKHTNSIDLNLQGMEFDQDNDELYCEIRVATYNSDVNPNELSKVKLNCRGNAVVDNKILDETLIEFSIQIEKDYINNKK